MKEGTRELHSVKKELKQKLEQEIKHQLKMNGYYLNQHNVQYVMSEVYKHINKSDLAKGIGYIIQYHGHNLQKNNRGGSTIIKKSHKIQEYNSPAPKMKRIENIIENNEGELIRSENYPGEEITIIPKKSTRREHQLNIIGEHRKPKPSVIKKYNKLLNLNNVKHVTKKPRK